MLLAFGMIIPVNGVDVLSKGSELQHHALCFVICARHGIAGDDVTNCAPDTHTAFIIHQLADRVPALID